MVNPEVEKLIELSKQYHAHMQCHVPSSKEQREITLLKERGGEDAVKQYALLKLQIHVAELEIGVLLDKYGANEIHE